VKFLHCDNAGENTKGLSDLCLKSNIQIEFMAPYTPQQNGIVERKFVTIHDRACAAMMAAQLSTEAQGFLWAEAISTFTRLSNSVAFSNGEMCPDYKFYGQQPVIFQHLIQFGQVGLVKIGKKVPKMEAKAVKCLMVGYSANHSADNYQMYNLETKKILNTQNVRWAEWHGHCPVIENVLGVSTYWIDTKTKFQFVSGTLAWNYVVHNLKWDRRHD
jgi:hypothetical protein